MATCRDCGADGRRGFDVVSKRWILLDPHPVPRARYAPVRNKTIVDMLPLPLTLGEIPARELVGLSIEQRGSSASYTRRSGTGRTERRVAEPRAGSLASTSCYARS